MSATTKRSDSFYEFAARNILSSSLLHIPGRESEHARCYWCGEHATHRMKLVNPSGTFTTCQSHFAGAGIQGNPDR